jgi:hypothetical protein
VGPAVVVFDDVLVPAVGVPVVVGVDPVVERGVVPAPAVDVGGEVGVP